MFLIPLFQVSAIASKIAAEQAAQRQRLGLPPPPPPPPKSEAELAKEKREDRVVISGIVLICLLECTVFCAPFIMLIYVAIKIMFAKQGIKWP